MSVQEALSQFKETEGGEAFRLQNSKLLKVELAGEEIQTKLGSMVAYQGDVRFEHAGSGGLSRMIKKAVTNEGTELMKIAGSGEVFLADAAQDIQLLRLDNERITANGPHVLAFESGIDWDIKRVEGASGALAGGLYNMELSGTGTVALVSDGPPVLIEIDGEDTFADPQAAITWSEGVKSAVKTDINMKTFIGKGSGETIQLSFSGHGWLLIQPSEGRVAAGSADVGPADLFAKVDFTDVTADDNPEWRIDLNDDVIGRWRTDGGRGGDVTLVWGLPLIRGAVAATAELDGESLDQAPIVDGRFTLIAVDAVAGFGDDLYLEIKLFNRSVREIASESLYAEADTEEDDDGDEATA